MFTTIHNLSRRNIFWHIAALIVLFCGFFFANSGTALAETVAGFNVSDACYNQAIRGYGGAGYATRAGKLAQCSQSDLDNLRQAADECNKFRQGTASTCVYDEAAGLEALTKDADALNALGASSLVRPYKCSATGSGGWSIAQGFVCAGNYILTLLGIGLVSAGALILALAGQAFNLFIKLFITGLNGFLFGGADPTIAPIVTQIWVNIRDIMNIAIVGFFTFIALCIILGLKTYGDKKLIARVLIIATLINFSFLFTRIIILASSSVSIEISKNISGLDGGNQSIDVFNTGTNSVNQGGVAGVILKALAVSNFSDISTRLTKINYDLQSGFTALGYGIFIAALLFATAALLIFGCVIILTRSLLFTFLLLTSSIAFATYLIPSIATGKYGWNSWWKYLLRCAALGPVFMFLLFASLKIIQVLSSVLGLSSDIVASPSKPLEIGHLVYFLFAIGFLFLTFKVSAALADSIPGLMGVGVGLGFSIPSSILGYALKQTRGRIAAGNVDRFEKRRANFAQKSLDAAAAGNRLGEMWYGSRAKRAAKDKAYEEKLSKSDFNLANTKIGKQLEKAAGVPSLLSGKSDGGGIDKVLKASAKASFDAAKAYGASPADEKKVIDNLTKKHSAEKQNLDDQRKEVEKQLADERSEAGRLQKSINKATEDSLKAQRAHNEEVNAAEIVKGAKLTESEKESLATHAQMRAAKANIETAKRIAESSSDWVKATQALGKVTKALEGIDAKHAAEKSRVEKRIENATQRRISWEVRLRNPIGPSTGTVKSMAQKMRKQWIEDEPARKREESRRRIREGGSGGGGRKPAAPPPSAGGTAH